MIIKTHMVKGILSSFSFTPCFEFDNGKIRWLDLEPFKNLRIKFWKMLVRFVAVQNFLDRIIESIKNDDIYVFVSVDFVTG